ncbi:hypothetical protein CsSME_00028691 [Camellia sinensis var. sinensis]
MAVSDIEAVLEFLKKNGFSNSQSALIEDLLDNSQYRSFHFDKFLLFPNLKISESDSEAEARDRLHLSDYSSEEFVSLGSSTTHVCSSEFTNPYGVHSRVSSQASSDRLSQFGTARDYHDFDVQNHQNWNNEKDEEYSAPFHFGRSDSFIWPSEDKFVMTLELEKQIDSQMGLNRTLEGFQTVERNIYLDKAWPFSLSSMDDVNGIQVTNYHHFEENFQEGILEKEKDQDPKDHTFIDLKDFLPNRNDEYEGRNDTKVVGEPHEPDGAADEEESVTADQLLMHDTNAEEYEVFNLRIVHRKNRTGFEENRDLPIVLNSIIGSRYYVTDYLGSAAFSKVIQAHDLHMGIDVCLKIIKNDKDFFDQSLDEIKLLKFVNKHDPGDEHHILRLYDYFYHQEHLFIVCELLQKNLYEFQKYNRESGAEPYFTLNRLQLITRQCLEAMEYLHQLGIIHCDLKPENILIKSYRRCEIKVIDLGSSCFQTDKLFLCVQSRSYRAPEVILGLPYDQKIDLWSLGCILAELCSGKVLFPNDALVVLLARMIGMLGPIDLGMLVRGQETHKYFTKDYDLYIINEETSQLEYIIPEEASLEHHLQVSAIGFIDFVRDLLEINPQRRPTAREALKHPWLSHQYDPNSC